MANKKLLVVDLDGTLFSVEERFKQCQQLASNNKKVFWSCFQSEQYMYLDRPINSVIQFVKSLIDQETIVVVLSGRNEETQLEKTKEQLRSIDLTPVEIYMRKKGDFRKDYEFKSAILRELLERYNPSKTIVIDDSEDVIKHLKEHFSGIEVIDSKTLY